VQITAARAAFLLLSQAVRVGRRQDASYRKSADEPVARHNTVNATAIHDAKAAEMAQKRIPRRDRRVCRRRKRFDADNGLKNCTSADRGATTEKSAKERRDSG